MIDPVILDNEDKRFWLPIVVLGLAALLPFEVYSAPEQSVPVQTAEQAPAAPTAPEALARAVAVAAATVPVTLALAIKQGPMPENIHALIRTRADTAGATARVIEVA